MTIKLAIEITSPLTVEDHEMLSGIAVMTLAIANRHLAEERFPEAFVPPEDGQTEDEEIARDAVEQSGIDPEVRIN